MPDILPLILIHVEISTKYNPKETENKPDKLIFMKNVKEIVDALSVLKESKSSLPERRAAVAKLIGNILKLLK